MMNLDAESVVKQNVNTFMTKISKQQREALRLKY